MPKPDPNESACLPQKGSWNGAWDAVSILNLSLSGLPDLPRLGNCREFQP